MTFYVQPSLTETTITDWTWWAVVNTGVSASLANGNILDTIPISAQVPTAGPAAQLAVDQVHSLYPMVATTDWVTAPTTAIVYNGTLVGQSGGINNATRPAIAARNSSAVTSTMAAATAGKTQSGLTIVGPRGLTDSHAQTFAKFTRNSSVRKVKP
jgi:hypothetical protein